MSLALLGFRALACGRGLGLHKCIIKQTKYSHQSAHRRRGHIHRSLRGLCHLGQDTVKELLELTILGKVVRRARTLAHAVPGVVENKVPFVEEFVGDSLAELAERCDARRKSFLIIITSTERFSEVLPRPS